MAEMTYMIPFYAIPKILRFQRRKDIEKVG
jgi:hypothetical protein